MSPCLVTLLAGEDYFVFVPGVPTTLRPSPCLERQAFLVEFKGLSRVGLQCNGCWSQFFFV